MSLANVCLGKELRQSGPPLRILTSLQLSFVKSSDVLPATSTGLVQRHATLSRCGQHHQNGIQYLCSSGLKVISKALFLCFRFAKCAGFKVSFGCD